MPKRALTREALDLLETYTFPGNVPRMKNMIEGALIESGGESIEPSHCASFNRPDPYSPAGRRAEASLPLKLEAADRALIIARFRRLPAT